jgi:hypothetical protein
MYMITTSKFGRPHRVPLPSTASYYGKAGSLPDVTLLANQTVEYMTDPNSDTIDINVNGALYEVGQGWLEQAKVHSVKLVQTQKLG